MALTKVTYTDYQTVIGAANLNAIQDEIIDKCVTVESKTFTAAQKKQAQTNIGLPQDVKAGSSWAAGDTIALAGLTATVVSVWS